MPNFDLYKQREVIEMQIQISGQNIDVTPELRALTIKKFDRVIKHAERITRIQVNFNIDRLRHIAEAIVHLPGTEIHASSESEHMETTLHDLIEKILRQISKYKEKLHDHR